MKVKISPSGIVGSLTVPPSKSSTQRAFAAALLHSGRTIIRNAGTSDDENAALDIIKQLGAEISFNGNVVNIISDFPNNISGQKKIINCGESGLCARLFTPVAALSSTTMVVEGEGSLKKRPMFFFAETLPQLNVLFKSANGHLPFEITGPLHPRDIKVSGLMSSQFLSGLLFAFGASVKMPVSISVSNLKSKPYIDLTINVLKHFGYNIEHDRYEKFTLFPADKNTGIIDYTVEGDWSSASFLFVAAAIAGSISLSGLSIDSAQADKKIIEALKLCGAVIKISKDKISIVKNELRAFSFDATNCPDLFPPLVALAAYCKGKSLIKGVSRLVSKESDRAASLTDVFGKMGIEIFVENDNMIITGGSVLTPATVFSHNDHRIAMAAAVAALQSKGSIVIDGAKAISKSYPGFFDDMQKLGVAVDLIGA